MRKSGYRFEAGFATWMMLIAFSMLSINGKGQVAIIVNPTALRAAPNEDSEVLDKLEVGFAIYIYDWDAEEYEDWHIVEYDNDTLSRARVDTSVKTTTYKGYISKEDLWYIDDLMTPDQVNLLEYTSDFDSSGHAIVSIMKNWTDYSYLDEPHWGTDGTLPRSQVDSITLVYFGNRSLIPTHLSSDIYETHHDEYSTAYYPPYYIFTKPCSDGAGGYDLTWVFREDELVQRLLVVPF
ncbi:hypothetical protein [Phaeocystidibacter luteus]|uniref:Uncharacterized protein n=1 Tax=Phaeocystidibacter luteus TaxID=911197 RepID=A0A6N6RII9_9FLAO|nr:hypothetical protein [Phaeocystidibacter luteus]KAB2814163.1 hypothetical protein F8C67_00085 [Phaeocystidibacter luteus]